MRRLFLYGSRILLAVAVCMAFTALIYLILNLFFGQGSLHPIYWLAYSSITDDAIVGPLCGSVLIVWSAFAALAILSYRFKDFKPYAREGVLAVLGTLIAIVLMLGAYFIRFYQSGPEAGWETIDNVSLNAHTYHLLLYSGDWADSWTRNYHLYECDSLDIFCSEVTITPQIAGRISLDGKIGLVTDTAANTIVIESDGVTVFTYHSK